MLKDFKHFLVIFIPLLCAFIALGISSDAIYSSSYPLTTIIPLAALFGTPIVLAYSLIIFVVWQLGLRLVSLIPLQRSIHLPRLTSPTIVVLSQALAFLIFSIPLISHIRVQVLSRGNEIAAVVAVIFIQIVALIYTIAFMWSLGQIKKENTTVWVSKSFIIVLILIISCSWMLASLIVGNYSLIPFPDGTYFPENATRRF